jgi:biopolymer transport protein ExbD
MKRLLSVCLSVLAGVAIFAASKPEQTLEMQKGISVQMAASRHAAPMPEADLENAWVVTVTTDGRIYFGVEAVTPETLTRQMQIRPRNRAAKLYVKADAGTPFRSVRQVLYAARVDLFDDVVLLTSQPEPAQPNTIVPGAIVPPEGLDRNGSGIESHCGTDRFGRRISNPEDQQPTRCPCNAAKPAGTHL